MHSLKVGVVGVGHLGKHHARILAGLPGVQLVGVADAAEANCRQVAAQHGVEAFRDGRDLIGKVDAAVLAVPTSLHHRLGLELLRNGVHLLIEKPLATTTAEADELLDAAKKAGAVLAVGHVERFNPAVAAVESRIRDPKYIEASRASGFTFRSTDIGVVLDLMIHDLDLVLSFVRQPVERVEALGVSIFGQYEDVANARLTFAGGCVATLSASRASYTPARTMQIWTPRVFAGLDFSARTATLVEPVAAILERRWELGSLSAGEREHLKGHLFEDLLRLERITPDACDQLTAELSDFTDAIRHGRAPRVDGHQARNASAVAERILLAIRTTPGTPTRPDLADR